MSKATAINNYKNMYESMKDAHETLMAEFIELIKAGKAKGEKLTSLTHVAGSSISNMGEEIARHKYALALVEADANMNYDLDTSQGIEDLNAYTQEKTDSLNKTLNRWVEVREHWKSKFDIEN